MVTRWSWNIDGLDVDNEVWNLIVAEAQVNPPTYVTIMDDKNKAKQWKQAIPSCQVIYRTYDVADNFYHGQVTPQNAALQLEHDHSDMRDFWHYYRINEPGGEWSKYQDWIIRFAQEAKARGFKVTAGGLALGKNWRNPDEIEHGLADAFLDYALLNEDTFLVDAHEYVTGALWSPQLPSYPSALFDRDLTLANENIPVIVDNYVGYQGFVNWGLFRICWLANARSLQRHGKRLNCVINEGLSDFNSHIIQPPHEYSTLPNGQRVRTEDEIRKYAEDRYNRDVRGILGHWLYLSWVVTGKMVKLPEPEYCDFIIRNFKWAEKSYPDNIKGIMLFAINKDWEVPEGHDYSPIIRTLLPKMKVLALSTPTPVPTPTPIETVTKRIRATDSGVRIRAGHTINSAIVGYLATEYVTAKYSVTTYPLGTQQDGHNWRYVELIATDSDNVLQGYVADSLVEIDEIPKLILTDAERALVLAHRNNDIKGLLDIVISML